MRDEAVSEMRVCGECCSTNRLLLEVCGKE